MRPKCPWVVSLLYLVLLSTVAIGDDFKLEDGFKSFFNGKDLTDWKLRGGDSLDGKTAAPKNRIQVLDGKLVIDGKTKGNMVIDSAVEFAGDVHIKFEYLPDEKCNNDLYFRGLKFDIKKQGVKNIKFGEWNRFEIVVTGDQVEFKNDGEVQRTQKAKNNKSPLGVRAEFGAIEIRHMRYKAADEGATQKSKRLRVAFVTNANVPYWHLGKAGALAAAKDFDVEVEFRMPNVPSVGEQERVVEDLLIKGCDGIAIAPVDTSQQVGMINRFAERTHLITHDIDVPDSKRRCYVGMDNYAAGRLVGKLVKEAIPMGGKVAVFIGWLQLPNARERYEGVVDELLGRDRDPDRKLAKKVDGDKYKVVAVLEDRGDQTTAVRNVEDAITAYPDLSCMVGLFAYNPPMCRMALKKTGKTGDIKVVAFDEDEATLEGIRDGSIHGTVVQNPSEQVYESIRILAGLAKGDESLLPKGGWLRIKPRAIRTMTVANFEKELQAQRAATKPP